MIGFEPRDAGGWTVTADGAEVGFVEQVGEGADRWAYWHFTDRPLPCAVLAGTGTSRAAAVAHHLHPDLHDQPDT